MVKSDQMGELLRELLRSPLASIESKLSTLQSLSDRLDAVERSLKEFKSLGQDFWRGEAVAFLAASSVATWRYDAGDTNHLFDDLFEPEVQDNMPAKRWVGRSGRVGARIAINRAVPLRLSIKTRAFINSDAQDSFGLAIDGEPLAWELQAGDLYVATIRPVDRPILEFSAFVDPQLIPEENDVSFAFESILIQPL